MGPINEFQSGDKTLPRHMFSGRYKSQGFNDYSPGMVTTTSRFLVTRFMIIFTPHFTIYIYIKYITVIADKTSLNNLRTDHPLIETQDLCITRINLISENELNKERCVAEEHMCGIEKSLFTPASPAPAQVLGVCTYADSQLILK